jgi:hypothetical protein
MKNQIPSARIFDLDGTKSKISTLSGKMTIMNADNFPILIAMGAALLSLKKGGDTEASLAS